MPVPEIASAQVPSGRTRESFAHLPVGALVHLVELVDVVLFVERVEELLGAAAWFGCAFRVSPDSRACVESASSLQYGQ